MTEEKQSYRDLREWRNAKEMTQEQAAAELAISQASYSKFENHVTAPRPRHAKTISEKTGVPLESVLGLS